MASSASTRNKWQVLPGAAVTPSPPASSSLPTAESHDGWGGAPGGPAAGLRARLEGKRASDEAALGSPDSPAHPYLPAMCRSCKRLCAAPPPADARASTQACKLPPRARRRTPRQASSPMEAPRRSGHWAQAPLGARATCSTTGVSSHPSAPPTATPSTASRCRRTPRCLRTPRTPLGAAPAARLALPPRCAGMRRARRASRAQSAPRATAPGSELTRRPAAPSPPLPY